MKKPDAIAILAASVIYERGGWRSSDLTAEDDAYGAPGGRQRVIAAALLGRRYPSAFMITTGGKGYDVSPDFPEDRPLLCEILRDELLREGVAAERIILERSSNNTYQELQELEKMARTRGWAHLAIVSNRWHLPRAKAMMEAKFPGFAGSAELVAAEDVLLSEEKDRWEKPIAQAYGSAFMEKRISSEQRGIEGIKEGSYLYK